MATKRTPIRRDMIRRISPEAVELYRRAREMEVEGSSEKWEDEGGRRREYLDAHVALDATLGVKPWQISPLDVDDDERPDFADDMHGWEQAREFQRQLDEASR